MMKQIIIITDGSVTMGLGHVYRTLALARELDVYAKITFLTSSGSAVVEKIKASGYNVNRVNCLREMKKILHCYMSDIVVIDKLSIDEKFAKYVKDVLEARLVIFGNVTSANKYADLVVNAIIGTNYKNKSYIDKTSGTVYLEGPKYLVLRKEFYRYKRKYRLKKRLVKILLLFGGSDQANLTSKVLVEFLKLDFNFEIDIILGAAFKWYNFLRKILKTNKTTNVNIYRDTKDVYKLMLKSNLVITSPGTTMFESFCLGIPTIALYQNEAQKKMFNGFIVTYDFDKITNFSDFLFNAYKNYPEEQIDLMESGMGKNEIIDKILGR